MSNFTTFLFDKFLEWQKSEGKRKSVTDFAEHVGVSHAAISLWMNGNRVPNKEMTDRLAAIFGLEVYDALDLPRPDEDLHFIQTNWDDLPDAMRREFRKKAEEYKIKNETNVREVSKTKRPANAHG